MFKIKFRCFMIAAASLSMSGAAFGQFDIQVRARQLPGWDARAREGKCEVRLWVDNRAEIRLRGDSIFMRTIEGSKSRDEGSECSQALPYNSVGDFQIHQTAGRSPATLTQTPNRGNNFTAVIQIEDRQSGGDNYAFAVSWRPEEDVAAAPAPFFDDVRACQDVVRQRFVTQNGRGSYIDFEPFANRQGYARDGGRGRGQGRSTQESIQGRGSARTRSESRDLSYSCGVDTRRNTVVSGSYEFTGASSRTQNGNAYGRELR